MKILNIVPYSILPANAGGKVRIFELAKEISNIEKIDALSLVVRVGKINIKINDNFTVKAFRADYSQLINLSSKFNLLPPTASYPLHKIFSPLFKEYFENYDIYQFEHPWLSSWYRLVPSDKPIIYVAHNVEKIWNTPIIKRCLFPDYFLMKLEKIERYSLENSDMVISVSEEDKDKLIEMYGISKERIKIIPNGYNKENFRIPSTDEKAKIKKQLGFKESDKVVLFTGSNVHPNHEALEVILKEIVKKVDPINIKFLIAGSVGEKYKKLNKGRVRITGKVEDIRPYFYCADAAINPIISGSGSNIKILEYLAAGLPVITTDFGMRGFTDLKKYVTICNVDDFANYIQNNECIYNEKVSSALRRYQWNTLSREMITIYKDLC